MDLPLPGWLVPRGVEGACPERIRGEGPGEGEKAALHFTPTPSLPHPKGEGEDIVHLDQIAFPHLIVN